MLLYQLWLYRSVLGSSSMMDIWREYYRLVLIEPIFTIQGIYRTCWCTYRLPTYVQVITCPRELSMWEINLNNNLLAGLVTHEKVNVNTDATIKNEQLIGVIIKMGKYCY